jgi:hypothetical protein
MIAASRGSTPNTLETTSEVPLMLMMTSIREPKRTPSTTTPLASLLPSKRALTNSGIV